MEVDNDARFRCMRSHINKPENTLSSRLAVDFLALPLNTVLCKIFQGSTAHGGVIRALNCSHCSLSWVEKTQLHFAGLNVLMF